VLLLFYRERGVGRVQWRRSFGASPLNVKEDVATLNVSGSAGQNNGNADWLGNADYTFLMSCDLIESCRSLNGEMSWDNGDLDMEHLRMAEMSARSTGTNNQSVAVGCQTDAEVTIPGIKKISNSVIVVACFLFRNVWKDYQLAKREKKSDVG
jgi:hypothetical protein